MEWADVMQSLNLAVSLVDCSPSGGAGAAGAGGGTYDRSRVDSPRDIIPALGVARQPVLR